MKGKIWLSFFSVLLATGCSTRQPDQRSASPAAKAPNIIIILADDLGYSDLSCYGGEISTPALDQLAANGMRMTQFYNTSRCCPTRASLLTGLYPHEAGIGRMTFDTGLPGYRGFLKENTATIAELLRQAGYNTGMTGKWHVSLTKDLGGEKQLKWLAHQADYGDFADRASYPTAKGFDKYFGNIWGVVDYFDPFSLVNGEEPVKEVPKDYYYTDAIGDTTLAYVEAFSKQDKPFFLYVAHCAPHWPLQALPEDIKKYEDVYKVGWDVIRKGRYEKMTQLGLLDPNTAPLSAELFPEEDWEKNPHQAWDARAMAVHAAMVDRMDQNIGNLIQKLKEIGQLDNTIIFFLSDNGASSERPSRYGPGFDRAGSTRDGRKVVFPVDKDVLPGPQTTHAGIGPVWANVSNTPFRYYKTKVHEGGIATPLIVHWPAGLARKGTVTAEPGHVVDLMATCLDLAGATYPASFHGRALSPMAGKSLVPVIRGQQPEAERTLYWEHFGARAIRQGHWKLVMLDQKSDWELYNLAEDKTETNNLVRKHAEKVEELSRRWQEWADQQNVFPAPNS